MTMHRPGCAGTYSSYTAGCRCDDCREANRAYKLNLRRDNGAQPQRFGRTHGRAATYNAGCRCADCTRVSTERRARARVAAKERAEALERAS